MSEDKVSLDALRIERGPADESSGRRKWWTLAIVLLLGAAGLAVLRRNRPVEVRTHTVVAAAGTGRTVLNASGYVVARRAATVSSKVTGKVVEVLVEEGMRVEADQVLARLDDTNIRTAVRLAEAQVAAARAALAETRAQLDLARKELRRITELSATQVASASDLDRAQSEVQTLEARIESQQAQVVVAERALAARLQDLEDTVIRAPFTGIATSKNAQPGEMISPVSAGGGFTRTGIGTIVDMGSLEIEVEVNESYLKRVHPDQRVDASLDAYPDWKIPARVLAIIPTADRQKATVKVRVKFDTLDPRMLPEMGVKVAFLGNDEQTSSAVVSVPKSALRRVDNRDGVLLVRGDQVERREVTVGLQRADAAEVSAGLSPGDKVVVEGPAALPNGTRVREKIR